MWATARCHASGIKVLQVVSDTRSADFTCFLCDRGKRVWQQ